MLRRKIAHLKSPKISVFTIPTVVDIVNGKINGAVGRAIGKLYTVVASAEGEIGGDIGNGSYSGMVGILQRQEADFSFAPFGMNIPPGVVNYTTVTNGIFGRSMHFPVVTTKERSFVDTLNIFPISVLASILSANITFAAALYVIEALKYRSPLKPLQVFFESVRCYINQTRLGELIAHCRSLVSIYLVTSFIVMETFENAIHADFVIKNFSSVVQSVADFSRLSHYKPRLVKDDSFTNTIRFSTNQTHLYEVWKRAVNTGVEQATLPLDPTRIPLQLPGYLVFFGNEYIARSLSMIYCRRRGKKYWISKKPYVQLQQAFYVRSKINSELKKLLEERAQYIASAGLVNELWNAGCTRGAAQFGSSLKCAADHLDDLFDGDDLPPKIALRKFLPFFLIFSAFMLITIAILLIERVKLSPGKCVF